MGQTSQHRLYHSFYMTSDRACKATQVCKKTHEFRVKKSFPSLLNLYCTQGTLRKTVNKLSINLLMIHKFVLHQYIFQQVTVLRSLRRNENENENESLLIPAVQHDIYHRII